MNFTYGYKSSIGVGAETTYGTAVTPTDFVEFTSESLKTDIEKRPAAGINTTAMVKKYLSLGYNCGGNVQFEVNPDDVIGLILKNFGGASAVSAQVGTSAYYTHTFKGNNDWIADGQSGCGLTLQVNRDGTARDYSGCCVNSINFNASVGQALMADANFIGQQEATQGSPTSPSFTTLNPFVFQQGVFNYAGAPKGVTNFTLDLSNNSKADTYILSQRYIKRPARGMRSITGSISFYKEDNTIYTAFTADTNPELVLTFTSGSYSLAITLGKVYFTNNPQEQVNGAGELMVTAPFTSFYDDATDQDYKIVLTNTTSSY